MAVDAATGAQDRVVVLRQQRLRDPGKTPSLVRRPADTLPQVGQSRSDQDGAPACEAENEALLIARLQAFGLIESNGEGGWRLTECCQAGLAVHQDDIGASSVAQPAVIRLWRPRTL